MEQTLELYSCGSFGLLIASTAGSSGTNIKKSCKKSLDKNDEKPYNGLTATYKAFIIMDIAVIKN